MATVMASTLTLMFSLFSNAKPWYLFNLQFSRYFYQMEQLSISVHWLSLAGLFLKNKYDVWLVVFQFVVCIDRAVSL